MHNMPLSLPPRCASCVYEVLLFHSRESFSQYRLMMMSLLNSPLSSFIKYNSLFQRQAQVSRKTADAERSSGVCDESFYQHINIADDCLDVDIVGADVIVCRLHWSTNMPWARGCTRYLRTDLRIIMGNARNLIVKNKIEQSYAI
jgi:hypothetical protein